MGKKGDVILVLEGIHSRNIEDLQFPFGYTTVPPSLLLPRVTQ